MLENTRDPCLDEGLLLQHEGTRRPEEASSLTKGAVLLILSFCITSPKV